MESWRLKQQRLFLAGSTDGFLPHFLHAIFSKAAPVIANGKLHGIALLLMGFAAVLSSGLNPEIM